MRLVDVAEPDAQMRRPPRMTVRLMPSGLVGLLVLWAGAGVNGADPHAGVSRPNPARVEEAIRRGVGFLERAQLPHGEFPLYWYEEGGMTWHEAEGVHREGRGALLREAHRSEVGLREQAG